MSDGRGKHPNSTNNLTHNGRPSSLELYGEHCKTRSVTITQTGWDGIKSAAKDAGYSSVSEFIECMGRNGGLVPAKRQCSSPTHRRQQVQNTEGTSKFI